MASVRLTIPLVSLSKHGSDRHPVESVAPASSPAAAPANLRLALHTVDAYDREGFVGKHNPRWSHRLELWNAATMEVLAAAELCTTGQQASLAFKEPAPSPLPGADTTKVQLSDDAK